ncbi:asialoglycoprotein receptor 1-like [Syngnathus typhle]
MAYRRKLQIADGSKRYRRSARRSGAVAVCLGLVALLLLGVIIAMLGHYIGPCRGNDMEQTSDFSACPNLKLQYFQLQGSYNTSLELKNQLDTELSFLTEEKIAREVARDNLKAKLDAFKSQMEYMQAETQQLAAKLERLRTGCPQVMPNRIGAKCYYFSKRGVTNYWDKSRYDCERRGGRLAIVKTERLMRKLSNTMSSRNQWIGLSRRPHSVWRWVDGTDGPHGNLWQRGYPVMYNYKQSCATLTGYENVRFQDQSCNEELEWICEKDI